MINSQKVLSSSEWTEFSKLHAAGDLGSSWVDCFFELKNTENTTSSLSGCRMNIGSTINPTNRIEWYIKSCLKTLDTNSINLTPSQVRILYPLAPHLCSWGKSKDNNVSKEMLFFLRRRRRIYKIIFFCWSWRN